MAALVFVLRLSHPLGLASVRMHPWKGAVLLLHIFIDGTCDGSIPSASEAMDPEPFDKTHCSTTESRTRERGCARRAPHRRTVGQALRADGTVRGGGGDAAARALHGSPPRRPLGRGPRPTPRTRARPAPPRPTSARGARHGRDCDYGAGGGRRRRGGCTRWRTCCGASSPPATASPAASGAVVGGGGLGPRRGA